MDTEHERVYLTFGKEVIGEIIEEGIEMEATITSKGQVTLPKPIRDRLDLKAGDRIAFSMEDDGRLMVTPITGSVMDLAGMLPRPAVPLSQEEMDEAIAGGAVRRALRR